MAHHGNLCRPGEKPSDAFAESMAVWILAAAKALSDNLDRQDAAVFILVSYLMRHLDVLREKLGDDPEAQRLYCLGAMLNNRKQYNRAEAKYTGPLCQIEEEFWLDAVAEPVCDHADVVVAWVTLNQEMDGAKLTLREREVYVLIRVYEMSLQDIADELGISKTRVRVLRDSARDKIQAFRMKEHHVFES